MSWALRVAEIWRWKKRWEDLPAKEVILRFKKRQGLKTEKNLDILELNKALFTDRDTEVTKGVRPEGKNPLIVRLPSRFVGYLADLPFQLYRILKF